MLAPDMSAEELARADALAVRWTSDPGLIAADLSISP
jgi:hypothetical protein